jgi:hypothetical protein
VADPLGSCPFPPAPMGGFRWSFGDGTTATTPPQVFARAWFSPFIHHTYRHPGTYQLTVSASDQNGQTDSMTLPVHVYPVLRVAIVRRGRRATARASGGDGTMLAYRWTVNGRPATAARTILVGPRARLRVTVSDAAGGTATALSR